MARVIVYVRCIHVSCLNRQIRLLKYGRMVLRSLQSSQMCEVVQTRNVHNPIDVLTIIHYAILI